MKKFILPVTAVLAAVVFFASCSMEKRHYRPGYHVEWKNNQHTTATGNEQTSVKTTESTVATQAFQAPVMESAPAAAQQTPVAAPAPVTTFKAKSSFAKTAAVNSVVEKKSESNNVSSVKAILKKADKQSTQSKPAGKGPSKGLLIVLAILIPWLAVGLATDWDVKPVVICLLLGFLFCLPGIIYAIIVVNREA